MHALRRDPCAGQVLDKDGQPVVDAVVVVATLQLNVVPRRKRI